MVCYGVSVTEKLIACYDDGMEMHFVTMTKHADMPIFSVSCCCDDDWYYEFYLENNTDYERVKFNILSAIFECEDMDSLMRALSETFENGFADILVKDECECNENCEAYKCK